jgi:hypothetical protein
MLNVRRFQIARILSTHMAKSPKELAIALVKVLDGTPIDIARTALQKADEVLLQTQTVSAQSPLLLKAEDSKVC